MASPTIVFDLDGTLADTKRDLISVLNRTTATRGLGPIAMSDAGNVVGAGAKAMIKKAFDFNQQELDDEALEALFQAFLIDYGNV